MQYSEGLVSVTNQSNVVTGVGTSFTQEVSTGDMFKVDDDPIFYYIASVDSDTQLKLTTNYVGTNQTNIQYTITRDFSPNLNLYLPETQDRDPAYAIKDALLKIDEAMSSTSSFSDFTDPITIDNTVATYSGSNLIIKDTGPTIEFDDIDNSVWRIKNDGNTLRLSNDYSGNFDEVVSFWADGGATYRRATGNIYFTVHAETSINSSNLDLKSGTDYWRLHFSPADKNLKLYNNTSEKIRFWKSGGMDIFADNTAHPQIVINSDNTKEPSFRLRNHGGNLGWQIAKSTTDNLVFRYNGSTAFYVKSNYDVICNNIVYQPVKGNSAVTLSNGWTHGTGNDGSLKIRKQGDKICHLSGAILPGTRYAGTVVATLPSWAYPYIDVHDVVCAYFNWGTCGSTQVKITKTGDVALTSDVDSNIDKLHFNITYET